MQEAQPSIENERAAVVARTPVSETVADRAGANGRPALRDDMEALKGFAIALVALGHVYDPSFPEVVLDLRKFIYVFHMPLFMAVSGFLFAHSGILDRKVSLIPYVRRRADRLLLPFLLMALVIILGKYAASFLVDLRKPVPDPISAWVDVFWNTQDSPVLFIWYLIVLFYFNVSTLLVMRYTRVSFTVLIFIAIALHLFHVVLYMNELSIKPFYISRFMMYYVFFMLGVLLFRSEAASAEPIHRILPPLAIVAILSTYSTFDSEFRYLIAGSILALVCFVCARFNWFRRNPVLLALGANSFAIYLFNLPAIGVGQQILAPLDPEAHAWLIVVLCTCAGILGPMLLKRFLQTIPATRGLAARM